MKDLLLSRKFWAALLVLAVIVVSAFSPGFDMDTDAAAGLVVIAVSYIVGVAVDPGPGGWKGVLESRKFWAAVLGFLVMILDGFGIGLPFELSIEQLVSFVLVITGFITAVAVEKPKVKLGG